MSNGREKGGKGDKSAGAKVGKGDVNLDAGAEEEEDGVGANDDGEVGIEGDAGVKGDFYVKMTGERAKLWGCCRAFGIYIRVFKRLKKFNMRRPSLISWCSHLAKREFRRSAGLRLVTFRQRVPNIDIIDFYHNFSGTLKK